MFVTQIVVTDRPYEHNRPAQATSHKADMPHNRTVVVVSRVRFPGSVFPLSTYHLCHEARPRC